MKEKSKASRNKAKDVKPLTLRDLNVNQLKVLAYDKSAERERLRQELLYINDLIQEKSNELGKTTGNIGGAKKEIKNPSQETEKKD